jgi:hypothetical protein
MPQIDESKLADILNSLLTDNIKIGSKLVQDLEKSTDSFNKSVESFSNNISSRTSEVKELAKTLNNAPKISKTLKISSLAASVAVGAALGAILFSYSLSNVTFNFLKASNALKELTQKYDELENYAIALQHENIAYKRTLDKTLTQNGREKFREIYMEELEKIKEESK